MRTRIILAGASGLVGKRAAALLAGKEYDLHLVTRRKIDDAPKQATQHIAPPGEWSDLVVAIKPQTAISCLGTTMRAAGSKEAFFAVDYELVIKFAVAAKAGGAKHFISVSSAGADPDSSNFYLQTKGKAEAAITSLGFDRTDMMRPGLLRGDRAGSMRYGERIGILLSPFVDMLLMGPLSRYASIESEKVAAAIANLAETNDKGDFINENNAINTLAR
jgi:uncharacterized protein YbjT (DUF2867 family)